jgi:hypothetical protein
MEQIIKWLVSNHTFQDSKNQQDVQKQWNCIHGDYKQIFDYHKGTKNNTSYWDFTLEEWNRLHLPK